MRCDLLDAYRYLSSGRRVTRESWNTEGVYVCLMVSGEVPPHTSDDLAPTIKDLKESTTWYAIKRPGQPLAPWSPVVSDTTAKDWWLYDKLYPNCTFVQIGSDDYTFLSEQLSFVSDPTLPRHFKVRAPDGSYVDTVFHDKAGNYELTPTLQFILKYHLTQIQGMKAVVGESGCAAYDESIKGSACIAYVESCNGWMGWSNRASFCFTDGQVIKNGDSIFFPSTAEEEMQQLRSLYCGDFAATDDPNAVTYNDGVFTVHPDPVTRKDLSLSPLYIPASYAQPLFPLASGVTPLRGQWTVGVERTAKEAALLYADSVG